VNLTELTLKIWKEAGYTEDEAWEMMNKTAQKYGFEDYYQVSISQVHSQNSQNRVSVDHLAPALQEIKAKMNFSTREMLKDIEEKVGLTMLKTTLQRLLRYGNGKVKYTNGHIFKSLREYIKHYGYEIPDPKKYIPTGGSKRDFVTADIVRDRLKKYITDKKMTYRETEKAIERKFRARVVTAKYLNEIVISNNDKKLNRKKVEFILTFLEEEGY